MLISLACFIIAIPLYAQAPQEISNVSDNFIQARKELSIQEYIKSKNVLYLYEVARCESDFRIDVYGDSGLAYGILQFHKPTFEGFAKKYNFKGDYKNPYDQVDLAVMMWNDGYEYHWTCWKKVVK